MTTIFIDVKNRQIVSDTRVTLGTGKGKEYTTTQKVFKSKCGRFTFSGAGCCILYHQYLLKFGIEGVYRNETADPWRSCDVLITNTYNNQVKRISLYSKVFRNKVGVRYYSNYKELCIGSGNSIALAAANKGKDAIACVRYAAMKDCCTNDLLNIMEY